MMLKIPALAALVVLAQLANSNPTAPEVECYSDDDCPGSQTCWTPGTIYSICGFKNHFCAPSNWTSLTEAKKKCAEDNDCSMFYDYCGRGEFYYCSASVTIVSSSCVSTVYNSELSYELLGCFKDSIPRALVSLEGRQNLKSILTDYYTRRTDAVKKCYEATNKLGKPFFAVQDGGQCFSTFDLALKSDMEAAYSKYGPSSDCGSDGEGGPMANSVYKINKNFKLLQG